MITKLLVAGAIGIGVAVAAAAPAVADDDPFAGQTCNQHCLATQHTPSGGDQDAMQAAIAAVPPLTPPQGGQ